MTKVTVHWRGYSGAFGIPDHPSLEERIAAVPELMPPPEHGDKRWHWVKGSDGTLEVVEWSGSWWRTGDEMNAHLAFNGYVYIGPVSLPDGR